MGSSAYARIIQSRKKAPLYYVMAQIHWILQRTVTGKYLLHVCFAIFEINVYSVIMFITVMMFNQPLHVYTTSVVT